MEGIERVSAANEGIDHSRIHFVGNTMIDTLVAYQARFSGLEVFRAYDLDRGEYLLVTQSDESCANPSSRRMGRAHGVIEKLGAR